MDSCIPDAACDKQHVTWSAFPAVCLVAGHSESVLAVQFSPNGKYLASGSGDTTLRFWNLNTQLPEFECKVWGVSRGWRAGKSAIKWCLACGCLWKASACLRSVAGLLCHSTHQQCLHQVVCKYISLYPACWQWQWLPTVRCMTCLFDLVPLLSWQGTGCSSVCMHVSAHTCVVKVCMCVQTGSHGGPCRLHV